MLLNRTCYNSTTLSRQIRYNGKNLFNFAVINGSDSECNDDEDEPTFEEIYSIYKKMHAKWIEFCNINKILDDQLVNAELVEKEWTIDWLEGRLNRTSEAVKKINAGKGKMDDYVMMSQYYGDTHGLGYTGELSDSNRKFIKKTSVPIPEHPIHGAGGLPIHRVSIVNLLC